MPEVDGARATPPPPRARRFARLAIFAAIGLLLLGLLLHHALQPQQVTSAVLRRVGNALGLDISTSGVSEYRLRGVPTLVVRGVIAREPGATTPLLRADRIYLSLPWSTLRARGSDLTINRVELDRPIIDLTALQHWLARRPPGKTRIPTLTNGLRVRDGRILGPDWSLSALQIDLPTLYPRQPVRGLGSGRYAAANLHVPFALAITLMRPANDSALGIAGTVAIQREPWSMPAHVVLSGRLHVGDGWRLRRARLAAAARYVTDKTDLPFALGAAGIVESANGILRLQPGGIAVRGTGAIPDLDASGSIVVANALQLDLAGTLHAWPAGWPELPPPIGTSRSPMPFELHYAGSTDLSDIAALRLRRDATRFDGRFHLPALTAWIDAASNGSPLPPMDSRATAPTLEIAGAHLRGVEITLDDPGVQGTTASE